MFGRKKKNEPELKGEWLETDKGYVMVYKNVGPQGPMPEAPKKKKDRDSREFTTLDYSTIKDFTDWGQNRAINDVITQRMVDVKVREELMSKTPERDWTKIMITIVIITIAGGIAFMVISSFFNYQDAINGLNMCIIDQGRLTGELEGCKAQLTAAKTGGGTIIAG